MSYEIEQLQSDFKTVTKAGENMLKQSNRGTQYPLFVIQVDERQYVETDEDYDERERTDEVSEYWLCDACHKKHSNDEELPQDCRECDEDAYVHYKLVEKFDLTAGVFLSEEACETHIRENHYHYNNPRSYVISAWRNPEMQAIMRQTVNIGGKDIPSHYE